MSESIQNVGVVKGCKAIANTRVGAIQQTPLRSTLSCLLNTVAPHQIALKLGKVVTRVVTDFKSDWKLKYTGLSVVESIGEQNRCICNSASKGGAYPCPPAPQLSATHPYKNIFRDFGGSNVH